MGIEIEHKFLVISDHFKSEAFKKVYIKQGFLNSHKERTVRIRILDDKGFITIKGKSNHSGTSRFEWEKELSLKEAEQLFALCEKGIIEKHRYYVNFKGCVFEVDEFYGNNKGLQIAEIELQNENDTFERPDWLGKEVTGFIEYYNSNLSKRPFCDWNEKEKALSKG